MSRMLVAMSGGVDSSVAAALLLEEGHDVTGVHLRLAVAHDADDGGRTHGCCGVADADDARRVAQVLDIPFYVWNMTELFEDAVVDDFVTSYAAGETPNPCVRCNERVKFGALLDRAVKLGFDAIATGHYAIATHTDRPRLFRATDRAKDQSYVLSRSTTRQLAHARFPLGSLTKPEVRALAAARGLRTAAKPESYDICFIPDGDTGGFLEDAIGERPGAILDEDGVTVGEHTGVHRFTVGQRRGLGLGTHRRLHVVSVNAPAATIVVGEASALDREGLDAREVVWTAGAAEPFETVQIRAHGGTVAAAAEVTDASAARIRFAEPLRGVSPGQLVAFYRGDEVVGGGTIAHAW